MFDFGRNKDMTENDLILKEQKEASICIYYKICFRDLEKTNATKIRTTKLKVNQICSTSSMCFFFLSFI